MSFTDPIPEASGNYIVDQWKGAHPLGQSYWINYILIGTVAGMLLPVFAESLLGSSNSVQLSSILILAILIVGTALYVWGVVGVWRSAGLHADRGGSQGWATTARIFVILGGLGIVARLPDTIRFVTETAQLSFGSDSIGEPAAVSIHGTDLKIQGPLSVGTAARVIELLGSREGVETVTIDSIGGRFGEALEIADAIRTKGLSTIASHQCLSACTFVLAAGLDRSQLRNAQIGFHQPDYPGLTTAEREMMFKEQREAYAKAGLPDWFIEKTLEAMPDSVWLPSEAELFDAGFLNSISESRILEEVKAAAAEMNAQAPIRLDDVTYLDRATAHGARLSVKYTVTVDRSQIDLTYLRSLLSVNNRSRVCSKLETRRLVDFGLIYEYQYFDRQQKPLVSLVIDGC